MNETKKSRKDSRASWRVFAGIVAANAALLSAANAYESPVHIFSINDVLGDFSGRTFGPAGSASDPTVICGAGIGGSPACPSGIGPVTDKEGVTLYPVDSEFGFRVVDFLGAETKIRDNDYREGFVGNIMLGSAVIGLKVSNAPTDTFKVKPPLGTWCQGLGGTSVKCSTEHYTVMEHALSCHEVIPYLFADPATGDQADLVLGETSLDCSAARLDDNVIVRGGTYDGQLLTDPTPGSQMNANDNTTVLQDIAASTDYSITLKDDGKPLYRWGGLIKRPNDIRLYARLALPAEWKEPGAPAYPVTKAHLVVTHWITNNPNDQLRPEDLENEAATGRKPSYRVESAAGGEVWKSLYQCYEGDGDFLDTEEGSSDPQVLAAGTVLKNGPFAIPAGSTGFPQPFSSDLTGAFTNAFYTTIDRDPFEWSYRDTGAGPSENYFVGTALPIDDPESEGLELVSGPRWRLKANKFGQDIPGLEIPRIACSEPPFSNDNIKYEVGTPVTTVINLLDWADGEISPLAMSTGWINANPLVELGPGLPGAEVTTNGLPMTEDFDLAVYIKGDRKSTALFSAQLQIEYDGEGPDTGDSFDLAITGLSIPERVLLGDIIPITVDVTNLGPSVAEGTVTLTGVTSRGDIIGPIDVDTGLLDDNGSFTWDYSWSATTGKVETIDWVVTVISVGDVNAANDSAIASTKVRRN